MAKYLQIVPTINSRNLRGIAMLLLLLQCAIVCGAQYLNLSDPQHFSSFMPQYHHLTTANGLPSNSIYAMHQDTKGHIWVATDNGVSMFNGQEFRNFDISDGICSNSVIDVTETIDGRIWFLTYQFEIFYFDSDKDSMYCTDFDNTLPNDAGNIWVDGIYPMEKELLFCGRLGYHGRLSVGQSGSSCAYTIDQSSEFIARVPAGENEAFPVINRHKKIDHQEMFSGVGLSESEALSEQIHFSAFIDSNTLFSIGTHVFLVSPAWELLGYLDLPADVVGIHNYNRSTHTVWIGTYGGGVFRVSTNQGLEFLEHLRNGQSVTDVLLDSEKGLWLSTGQDGIYYRANEGLLQIAHEGLTSLQLKSVAVDACNHRIYAGGKKGQLYSFVAGDAPGLQQIAQLSPYLVDLWEFDRGAMAVSVSTSERYNLDCSGLLTQVLWVFPGIYKNALGGYSVLTTNFRGLIDYDVPDKEETFTLVESKWIFGRIKTVQNISDTTHYVQTHTGLLYYNSKRKKYTYFHSMEDESGRIKVTDIDRLSGDTFLISTNGFGLFAVYQDQVLEHLTTQNVLMSNRAMTTVVKGDSIWIGSDLGVQELVRGSGAFFTQKQYRAESGFPISHVNCMEYGQNMLLIGTESSTQALDFSKTTEKSSVARIELTSIYQDNEPLKPDAQGHFFAPNAKGSMQISFVQKGFRNLFKRLYRYRILGLDTQWIQNREGELILHKPSAGTYTLQVAALDGNGQWSDVALSAVFTIPSPFYATFGFRMAGILLIVCMVLIVFYLQRRALEKSTQQKLLLATAKNKALGAQLNPHFLYNVLNTVGGAIARGNQNDSLEIITRFSKLLRRVFANSHHDLVPLEKEVSAVKSYVDLEMRRMEGVLDFKLKVPEEYLSGLMVPPLFIQPLVENAIWHGVSSVPGNGKVEVEVVADANLLSIQIKNTGIPFFKPPGKASDVKYESSLAILYQRMDLLKRIYDQSAGLYYQIEQNDWATVATLNFPKIVNKEP